MAISAITLAELIHGAEKSQFPERNLAVIEDFCRCLQVLPYTKNAGMHYGNIRAALERIGQPIGFNDLHIARPPYEVMAWFWSATICGSSNGCRGC